MKKLTLMTAVFFLTITLGSVCGAGDKTGYDGYVVKETFQFRLVPDPEADPNTNGFPWGPWGTGTGTVFCINDDFVTGCSHALESYPGYTRLDEYSFINVIPIQCEPDSFRDKDSGKARCKGCLVHLTVNHPQPPPVSNDPEHPTPTDGYFRAYAYCAKR